MSDHANHDRRGDDQWRRRVDEDINGLSQHVSELSANFAGLRSSTHAIKSSVDKLADAFDASRKENTERQRPVWGNYIATGSLILAVIALWSAGYIRDLDRIEQEVNTIQGNRTSFADPVQNAAIAEIRRDHYHYVDQFRRDIDGLAASTRRERRLVEQKNSAILENIYLRINRLEKTGGKNG